MKPYKNKVRGYVNMSSAVIESEVERQAKAYGPNYSSIDFGFNPDLKEEDFPIRNFTTLGTLMIGNVEITLTKAECEKVMMTMHEAIQSSQKKYRLGILA
jgi:predicted transport protein